MKHFICHFDGSCWPNPGGPMGAGVVIYEGIQETFKLKRGEIVFTDRQVFDEDQKNSNNVAEYLALEKIVDWLIEKSKNEKIKATILGDSMLVVKQVNREWRVNKDTLYYEAAARVNNKLNELRSFCTIVVKWIPREKNQEADKLSR